MQPSENQAPRQSVLSMTVTHRDAKGKFRNPWPGARPHGFRDFLKWAASRGRDRRNAQRSAPPAAPFPHATPSFATPRADSHDLTITWIGHSSFLLQINSANVLLDPIWSDRASPIAFAGPKRITPPAVQFDSLPSIDLVLLSHDHYDHLDLPTVRSLIAAHPRAVWVAPLGVGAWLRARGAVVAAELDWWQSASVLDPLAHDGLHLDMTCAPAQHFSGRRLGNRDSTLWCGWVIRAAGTNSTRAVFFAGDTGLHPEFGDITRRLGPFDAAFLPIGAYDPRWFMQPVHMAPEEAVAAYGEISAANAGHPCVFVAMHWGTFRLTDEPPDEPPRLTRAAWTGANLDPALLWIPRHGETLRI
jgi:N-acyl-phosphatidylethanolamine-hydrolysing phospholipase D